MVDKDKNGKVMLKYFFEAQFTDGTYFTQNKEDKSEIDPTRSSFYDLLQVVEQGKKIHVFRLTDNQKTVLEVNLLNGIFALNGVLMFVKGDPLPPISEPEFRLIFFREHQDDVIFTKETGKMKAGDQRITYYAGWQITINGKNYQQIIGII